MRKDRVHDVSYFQQSLGLPLSQLQKNSHNINLIFCLTLSRFCVEGTSGLAGAAPPGGAAPPVTVRTRQIDGAHLARHTASACAVAVKYLRPQGPFRWPLHRVAPAGEGPALAAASPPAPCVGLELWSELARAKQRTLFCKHQQICPEKKNDAGVAYALPHHVL